MKRIALAIRIAIASFLVIFVVTAFIDFESEQISDKEITYIEFIKLIEEGEVRSASILNKKTARVAFNDGRNAEVDIEGEENLLQLLIKNNVSFVSSSSGRQRCKKKKLTPGIENKKYRWSYNLLINKINSNEINRVDIYCQNYVLLKEKKDDWELSKVNIPRLNGAIEDLIIRLEENMVEFNHYK